MPATAPSAENVPVWEGFAAKNTALAKGLEKLAAADAEFDPRAFIEGAKAAFEIVISAFARGDKQALKPLLSAEVMDGFSQDIDRRGEVGEKLESSLVGIVKTAFVKADVVGRKAVVTLRFVSETHISAAQQSPVRSSTVMTRRSAKSPMCGPSSVMSARAIRTGPSSPPNPRPEASILFTVLVGVAMAAATLGFQPFLPRTADLEPVSFADIDGWLEHDFLPAFVAFRRSCAEILANGRGIQPRRPLWRGAAGVAFGLQRGFGDRQQAGRAAFFRNAFSAARRQSIRNGPRGCSPAIMSRKFEGSRHRTAAYPVPLYAKPGDLVAFDKAAERKTGLRYGRLIGRKPAPYLHAAARSNRAPLPAGGSKLPGSPPGPMPSSCIFRARDACGLPTARSCGSPMPPRAACRSPASAACS